MKYCIDVQILTTKCERAHTVLVRCLTLIQWSC